jgi:hypothetical protein
MSYEPVLPNPVRHKIAGWNLPPSIELALLEELERHLALARPTCTETLVSCFEFYPPDPPNGGQYGFYVQYSIRLYRDVLAVLDMSIDFCPCQQTDTFRAPLS